MSQSSDTLQTRSPSPTDSNHAAGDDSPPQTGVRCDFCSEVVGSVSRVALDGDYERLRTPHRVRYACPRCSERKEQQRKHG